MAERLLEVETINREEFERIFPPPVPKVSGTPMAIDRDNGAMVSGPDIISRGFVYVRENEDIIESSRELARNIIMSYGRIDGSEWQNMKNRSTS